MGLLGPHFRRLGSKVVNRFQGGMRGTQHEDG